jgi:hypothetical protein
MISFGLIWLEAPGFFKFDLNLEILISKNRSSKIILNVDKKGNWFQALIFFCGTFSSFYNFIHTNDLLKCYNLEKYLRRWLIELTLGRAVQPIETGHNESHYWYFQTKFLKETVLVNKTYEQDKRLKIKNKMALNGSSFNSNFLAFSLCFETIIKWLSFLLNHLV